MASRALPRLNRALLESSALAGRPEPRLLDLPEKVIQFGTGAFLRGFIEPLIDGANRDGRFHGRILALSSTGSGREQTLAEQDGLFTLAVRGVEHGTQQRRYELITSVSRAVPVAAGWAEVLRRAAAPQLELIVSNTTEVGITFDAADSLEQSPPRTFPARLARLLYERAQAFDYGVAGGVVVLPCELIEHNGDRLREYVVAHARNARVDARFESWLERSVSFCNTLVDRIVPGKLAAEEQTAAECELGYRDALLTAAEPYQLLAIQADAAARARLRFLERAPGVLLCDDITPYRLRKIRLLNGAHSIMAPLALLCDVRTVADAVQDEHVGRYLRAVLFDELVPATDVRDAAAYAETVLERFANPYLQHALLDITLQQTMKLRARVVPSIGAYHERYGRAPAALALGFAAYLRYLRAEPQPGAPPDDGAAQIGALWRQQLSANELAARACGMIDVWGLDLNGVSGFAEEVGAQLQGMLTNGVRAALAGHLDNLTKDDSRGLIAR